MITTQSDFETETAWERTVLALAIPMMPLTASGATLDLRTRNISIEITSTIGGGSDEALRNKLLPLLFGAAWKVLDLALELAFAKAGLSPESGRRWRIDEKSQHAAKGRGSLPGLSGTRDVWQALGHLYKQTLETRHALVHRRVQVDASTYVLTSFDPNGDALCPVSYNEQMAFCRLAQRVGQAVAEGTLRPRVEADLRKQLADLQYHHGVAVTSNAPNRPPVQVIADLAARGQIDVPHLLTEAQARFPGVQYVDLELQLMDGRSLVGELESAPQEIVTVDPATPPNWLSFV